MGATEARQVSGVPTLPNGPGRALEGSGEGLPEAPNDDHKGIAGILVLSSSTGRTRGSSRATHPTGILPMVLIGGAHCRHQRQFHLGKKEKELTESVINKVEPLLG